MAIRSSLEEIDPDVHTFTVIERTLEGGNREEVRWLFALYGRERMAGGTALAKLDIADHQAPVETRSPFAWEEVKSFLTSEIRRIGHR